MAMTIQQRRNRQITVFVLLAIAGLSALIGKDIIKAVSGPEGYAKKVPGGTYATLNWDILQQATWESGKAPMIPADMRARSGELVTVKGFLLPLHQGSEAASFFLAPKEGNCYFCSPPGVAEVIQVNIAGGKTLPLISSAVQAYGTFKVASSPNDQYLYVLDNAQLSIARK